MASIRLLFFVNSVMMTHFGRNPVSGGSPPVDSRINDIMGVAIGILFHISDTEVMDVNEWARRITNMEIVIVI